ncbi:hypothetical protein RhiirA5_438024 [Rhizophagus irregularis]|uniref:Uncharacterized protein n=1 Tax=Rhizophagus irregularis TaxID=588596 RepID=A0A2N0NJQ8_9GLOM|nr:hypothetical protein RhiirA5_438024 [Rhizophagus irregularis]
MDIQPQDNIVSTTTTNAPLLPSPPSFSSTFEYSFSTKKINPYEVRDTRGCGTLYNTKKGRYFLIELENSRYVDLRKKNFFNICTNDIQMPDDHHRIFNSNCKKLNLTYLIGTYLTFVFTLNKQFSPATVDRYFNRLRQLLIDKILAVKNRISSVSDKNRQTKTYIRFSSGPHVIYLGYYFACGSIGYNNQCCQQPAAVVLSHNRCKCNTHLPSFIIHGNKGHKTSKLPQNPSFYAHNRSYIPHNHGKEVHSTRLGISYNVITRRYNEWKGKADFYLQNVMEPTSTKMKKGVDTSRMYYKEYKFFALDDNRTQQQIKRWNRLKFSNFKSERALGQVKPFLINEHSYVYKKIQHAVERSSNHTKDPWEIERDKILRKRAKNWKRRIKMRNKKKKSLPTLPDNFTGNAISYYFSTYNINLNAYKVRRRYDLSGIREFRFGYRKAKRRYCKYQQSLRPRPPPIVEDKVIATNNSTQATFFSDKLILDFHRVHFAPRTPIQQQYPSTPEPDPLESIKDGDERPIRKPRKSRIKLPPTPGHDQ